MCRTLFDIEGKKLRIVSLDQSIAAEGFWNDQEHARMITKEREGLAKEVELVESLMSHVNDLRDLVEIVEDDKDVADLEEQLERAQEQLEQLELYTFFDGAYDNEDALVTVRAGAGGVDAQDWAEMVMRMYIRFAEQNEMHVHILERTQGSEAGIKSMTCEITGARAYGHLRAEHGVHRLVRLSPFNSDNLRQTSFAQVEIMPVIDNLPEVEVKQEDLKFDTYRSSGAGGQSVNTTDSAVRVTHVPTGLVAQCQNERSQLQNKEQALKILKAKLHQKYLQEQEEHERALRGEHKQAEWGSQIRSYVLHPYKLVKDHRTGCESRNVEAVLDGDVMPFITTFLRDKG